MVYASYFAKQTVTASGAVRTLGVRKTAVAALCAVFSYPHSSPPKTFGFSYKVDWNVSYLER